MRITILFVSTLAVIGFFARPSLELQVMDVPVTPVVQGAAIPVSITQQTLAAEKPRATSAVISASTSVPKDTQFIPEAPRAYHSAWKEAVATVFWVGEDAGSDNGFIHNAASAWDEEWEKSYGGYDDPECREQYFPCGFVPKENPFYVALPYNDIDMDGIPKEERTLVSWFSSETRTEKSILKNRWVEVRANNASCFGQWEDTGPFFDTDSAYVFGTATIPQNERGERAGIDLSPALRDCLNVGGLSLVTWRHVDESLVAHGPWKHIVTD